ncbi:MAG: hypothetical protein AAFZ18_37170 [Myxococcota bacterium]
MRAWLLTVTLGGGLWACGEADVENLGGEPSGPRPETPSQGEGPSPGFTPSLRGLSKPVVAVDSDGQLHVAGIDDATGWPAFWIDGELRAFPGGSDARAFELSMVGGPSGMLHAVWISGGILFYGRVAPELSRRTAVVEISRGGMYQSEVAVSDRGDVVIAGVSGNVREANMRVEMFRGNVESGFRGPEQVMPTCPRGCGGVAEILHLSGVNYERGYLHVAMTLTDAQGPRTILMTEGRGWYVQAQIPAVALMDAAALTLSARNESLLTVDEDGRELRLHDIYGSRTTRRALHRLDRIERARAARDESGVLHVLVAGRTDEARVIDYLRVDVRGVQTQRLATSTPERTLGLSPGTGALVVTDGAVVAPIVSLGRRFDASAELVTLSLGE